MADATKRYAVVTGGNKGIGFEICRQLASNGIVVILTARDAKKGTEAVQKLKDSGVADDQVLCYQLDVTDPASINPLPEFIKTRFRKLDILVNNAGITGGKVDAEGFKAAGFDKEGAEIDWIDIMTPTYESAEYCLRTNYYGSKRMIKALMPLLQLSDSPTIVNLSSALGQLQLVNNEWAKGILADVKNLTEEKIDEVVTSYLKAFQEGRWEAEGWPRAYTLSKASINAYTRLLAEKYPNVSINCVCPGFVKTEINFNKGTVSVEEGAAGPVKLALLPKGGPSGRFFANSEETTF